MTFIRIQFDERSRSFRLLENDRHAVFTDGDIYLIGVGGTELDSDFDSEWIQQAIPEAAHA